MTAMTRLEASTSTHGQADASRTSYCKDVSAIDDASVKLFDFMDPTYIRAVKSLPVKGAVEWQKGALLTSLSMDYYSTETHHQTILLYNGYISESHIPAGATINIPDVSGLRARLSSSKRGSVVRI